jgi:general secretion pathway protein K
VSCKSRPGMAQKQRGVVLVVILIIVALVALIATQITSQLLLNERRSANVLQTDQAWQYALGAEALAATHLFDALKKDDGIVHLGQGWAKNEFYFPIDGGGLRGKIEDMSTCFNLNALLLAKKKDGQKEEQGSAGQTPDKPINPQDPASQQPPGVQLLVRLFEQLVPSEDSSPQALAAAVVDWIDEDSDPFGSDGAEDYDYQGLTIPYRTGNGPLGAISELRTIKGFTPEIYQTLRPYLCVLPDAKYTKINANTLPAERAELLAVLFDNLPAESARQLLQNRPKNGFKDLDALMTASGMPADAKLSATGKERLALGSDYFLLRAEAVVGRGRARVESLLKRQSDKSFAAASRAFAEE